MSFKFHWGLMALLCFNLNAQNLITDPSFPSTNTSVITDLNHVPDCSSGAATYCISTVGWHGSDHSTPSDFMMKIDGSSQATVNNLLWSQTVTNIDTIGVYTFSFWCFPRSSQHTIELEILANGNPIDTFNYNSSGWDQFSTTFVNDTSASSLNIEIRQLAFGAFTDFDLDDLNLSFINSLSANEELKSSFANLYPNPVEEEFTLTLGAIPLEKVQIFDLHGRCVLSQLYDTVNSPVLISTTHLKAGTYIIKINDNYNQKFIKL